MGRLDVPLRRHPRPAARRHAGRVRLLSRRGSPDLLTSGADSAVKVWDIRKLRSEGASAGGGAVRTYESAPVRTFEGAGQTSARRSACFAHDETLVLGADEASCSVLVWGSGGLQSHGGGGGGDTAGDATAGDGGGAIASGGDIVGRCTGHASPIRHVAHSPATAAFISCAEDGAIRAWQA